MVGGEFSDIGNCNRPTGLACAGERWTVDECGSGVHVVQGSFWRRLGRAIVCSTSIVGVSHCKMPLTAGVEVGVVQFLCMHLVVVSEREICAVLLCVGVFCITMTKPGTGPNGCVSKLQVDVKRVNKMRPGNSRFTHFS